ncbi:hypothetical protein DL764_002179 [Monosporascus ibericus]|uniref:Hydrophobin n=1 Tax=Monosporascus ibericus TaxID=155417 RepID=A0A4Q4TRG3_9PEZI|nr:hypothetical protein DL764_002179 [Monosporascus ibericus]
MLFSTTALLSLVAGVLAVPHQPAAIPRSLTVSEASNKCGEDLVLSCCNEKSSNIGGGLLGGLLQGFELFSGCSQLSVAGIGGSVPIDNKCEQNVACCQGNDIEQSGLVNIGCLAFGSIV